ncbi:hypothetical protein FOA52_013527 [Chlamydomonas sp. UWO 241]|nr:hypothetical protein FOA52_013527 [Chlamydomonas sp. UWO 241]
MSACLLAGTRPCYRSALLALRDHLEVPCPEHLCTSDLESEVFLHLADNCLEYVQGDEGLDADAAASSAFAAAVGDGMGSEQRRRTGSSGISHILERAVAPLVFGAKDLRATALKLGGALGATAAGRAAVGRLGAQLVTSHVRDQAAVHLATGAARTAAEALGRRAAGTALNVAGRALAGSAARFSVLRGALGLLGPLMWGALVFDLGMKSIGTDHARVARAVFILAQVRLARTHGFVNS